MHRGIEGRLIEGELNEGWPDKHIAPAIDQHSLPRPLVQEAQLEPPSYRILHHKVPHSSCHRPPSCLMLLCVVSGQFPDM